MLDRRARPGLRAAAADAGRDDHAGDPGRGRRREQPHEPDGRGGGGLGGRRPAPAGRSRERVVRRRAASAGHREPDHRRRLASARAGASPAVPATPAAKTLALRLKQGRAQLLTNKLDVSVVAACGPVACRAEATGTISVAGRVWRLKPAKANLAAGRSVRLRLQSTKALRQRRAQCAAPLSEAQAQRAGDGPRPGGGRQGRAAAAARAGPAPGPLAGNRWRGAHVL